MAAEHYDKETLASWVRTRMDVALDPRTSVAAASIDVRGPLCPAYLGDVFGAVANEGHPEALLMSAKNYADMRVFGRDVMELETHAWVLRTGVQARLWGCPVIAGFRELQGSSVWVVGIVPFGWVKQEGRLVAEILTE